jgi:hypothetical protein
MLKRRPLASEFEGFYETYINYIDSIDICGFLSNQYNEHVSFYQELTEEQWMYRYAEGKWSIKDVLNHIIDTERVFSYRAMRISRNDMTELPGFDQDVFVENAGADERSSESLITEYVQVRQASIALFSNMSDEACAILGKASGFIFTPIGGSYMIAGHDHHHMKILQERYV